MLWEVESYEDDDGSSPVEQFLEALPDKPLGRVVQVIRLLKERGPHLAFPFSSQVEGKLRELRAHYGRDQYRVLYYGDPNRVFILLHAFRKHTAQIPKQDSELAQQRMKTDEQSKLMKGRR